MTKGKLSLEFTFFFSVLSSSLMFALTPKLLLKHVEGVVSHDDNDCLPFQM